MKKPTNLSLDESIKKMLDTLAKRCGVSKSALVSIWTRKEYVKQIKKKD